MISKLLFAEEFVNSLLSWHNRVYQVCVARELTPEVLYRRRKLGHKIAGFGASEELRSRQCLQQPALIKSCESSYDNSLRFSARDTKLRTITCDYLYKNFKKCILMNILFVVGFSRRTSCILFK